MFTKLSNLKILLSVALTRLGLCAFALISPHVVFGGSLIVFKATPDAHYTLPAAINAAGTIVGTYMTSPRSEGHGFLRRRNGNIVLFNVPKSFYTAPGTINSAGKIAGTFSEDGIIDRAFIRDAAGSFTVFDAPGASSTMVSDMNDAGVIVGTYNSLDHCFIRSTNGTFTVFDVPNSSWAWPGAINSAGEIAGHFGLVDNPGLYRVFVRSANGKITVFDSPHGAQPWDPLDINDAGQTMGSFYDETVSRWRGFIRSRTGRFTMVDGFGIGARAKAISPNGAIAGEYYLDNESTRGFLRTRHGFVDAFKPVPGCFIQSPTSINAAGETAGVCSMSENLGDRIKAFIRTP